MGALRDRPGMGACQDRIGFRCANGLCWGANEAPARTARSPSQGQTGAQAACAGPGPPSSCLERCPCLGSGGPVQEHTSDADSHRVTHTSSVTWSHAVTWAHPASHTGSFSCGSHSSCHLARCPGTPQLSLNLGTPTQRDTPAWGTLGPPASPATGRGPACPHPSSLSLAASAEHRAAPPFPKPPVQGPGRPGKRVPED